MKFKEFITEGWTRYDKDNFSIDRKGRQGTPVTCPNCGKLLTMSPLKTVYDDHYQPKSWKGKCSYCDVNLTMYND